MVFNNIIISQEGDQRVKLCSMENREVPSELMEIMQINNKDSQSDGMLTNRARTIPK